MNRPPLSFHCNISALGNFLMFPKENSRSFLWKHEKNGPKNIPWILGRTHGVHPGHVFSSQRLRGKKEPVLASADTGSECIRLSVIVFVQYCAVLYQYWPLPFQQWMVALFPTINRLFIEEARFSPASEFTLYQRAHLVNLREKLGPRFPQTAADDLFRAFHTLEEGGKQHPQRSHAVDHGHFTLQRLPT